jgi:hypothetical protein
MERVSDLRAEIDAFVRAERARSLWWLREGWMPEDDAGRLWLLDQIERRADRETFALARRLRGRIESERGAEGPSGPRREAG